MGTVRTLLRIAELEARVTPVVGSFASAPAATIGAGLDGVVLVQSPQNNTCSGALLATGRHILTVAHGADQDGDRVADGPMKVRFDLPTGTIDIPIDPSDVYVAPGWVGLQHGKIPPSGSDWAIITLPGEAPASADRYDLYRDADEVGRTFTVVGYGVTGTGSAGSDITTVGTKRVGSNRFDAAHLNLGADRFPPGSGLAADFDSGAPGQDAFGMQAGLTDTGLGAEEAMIAPGDSGGPALIEVNGRFLIAGIASFAVTSHGADIDPAFGRAPGTNNSFGEYFGYTRVSNIAPVIDQLIGTTPPPVAPGGTAAGPGTSLRPGEVAPADVAAGTAYAVGADQGSRPTVQLRNADGVIWEGLAHEAGFRGGVRVASADVTGDGTVDLIAAPGPGTPALVQIFDGSDGSVVGRFFAFEPGFRGGVFVAASDLTGDGRAEILLSADAGGGSRVRVFGGDGFGAVADFLGIEDPDFRGGTRIGLGDLNGDGADDLMVGAGYGGGPRVAVFDGSALGRGSVRKVVPDFFVFEQTLRNGVYVTGGDLDGDGRAELIAGGGPGGGPRVLAIDGGALVDSHGRTLSPAANFFAGNPELRGGVRVASKDLDADGRADLMVGPGEGGGSMLRMYRGSEMMGASRPAPMSAFEPFAAGGLFVG